MSNQTAVLVNPEKQDTEEEEARELISVLLIVTCPIFLLYSQYLLHKYKNERTIKKRSLFYIRLATVAGWLAELNLVISTLNIQAPCFIFYCVQLLIAPLAIGPQLLRSIRLWSMYKLSFLVLRQEVIRKDQSSRRMSSMKRAGTFGPAAREESSSAVKVAIEVNKVKKITSMAMRISSWGLISLPTIVLVVISMIWADSEKPGILLEADFAKCLPEPDR